MSSRRGSTYRNSWTLITPEELAKHDNIEKQDAWMSVRGYVYDVSEYAKLHPGGIEKIRKYAGKDATEVFNTVHPYVDIKTILGEYKLGILKGHPDAPKRNLMELIKPDRTGALYKYPTTWFKQDSIVVKFHSHSDELDWTVGVVDKIFLNVFKLIDRKKAWLSVYKLPEPLINDKAHMDFKNHYKQLEITFRKPIPATVWGNQLHGLRESGKIVPITEVHMKFDAFIIFKKCLTHDILMFGIQVMNSARINVPVGLHVNIYIGDVFRPYTPVNLHLVDPTEKTSDKIPRDASTVLYFMIKIYGNGKLTSALDKIPLDMGKEVPTLRISSPYGHFNDSFITEFNTLLLISGGSGITPMIKILKCLSDNHITISGKHVGFIYFCEKIHDIIWRKQFTTMQEETSWFFYFPVLTKPTTYSRWHGLTGRVNPDMMKIMVNNIPGSTKGLKKACVCGPPGFNAAVVDSLNDIIPLESIYVFTN